MTLHTTRTSIALAGTVAALILLHPCSAYATNNLLCTTAIQLASSTNNAAIAADAANNSSTAATDNQLTLQEINTAVVSCETNGNTVRDLGQAYASVALADDDNTPPNADPVGAGAAEQNALTQLTTAKTH